MDAGTAQTLILSLAAVAVVVGGIYIIRSEIVLLKRDVRHRLVRPVVFGVLIGFSMGLTFYGATGDIRVGLAIGVVWIALGILAEGPIRRRQDERRQGRRTAFRQKIDKLYRLRQREVPELRNGQSRPRTNQKKRPKDQ